MLANGSASSIRKKRNYKNLQLENSPVVEQSPDSPDDTTTGSNTRRNSKIAEYSKLCEQLSELEIGLELRLDIRAEEIQTLNELGAGNGGTVSKVLHIPTKTIMAKKIIHVDAQLNVRKQIMREMQFMHDCNSKHIVSFYGAYMSDGDISMCMEYMDVGSLDAVYKKNGPIPMDVLGKITYAVVDGLVYLYDNHRIIHRDIKPSNILVNSSGYIKICDFGVSGKLINSIADTFVGTSSYMSPERIQGSPYSVKSDVWSVGITLMELALGRFPLQDEGGKQSIFELLQHIVNEPPPRLTPGKFPKDFEDFIVRSLSKEPALRPNFNDCLEHEFVQRAEKEKVDVEKWAQSVKR